MPDDIDARTDILRGIRSALGRPTDAAGIASGYAAIPRSYKREGTLGRDALLDLFSHRLAEYDAGVSRVSVGMIREEVARTIIQHGWPLREIRLEHATLEEFFIQVTADQAAARNSGESK